MRQLKPKNVHDSYDLLTEREKEVLQLLAQGQTNKDRNCLPRRVIDRAEVS